jgi:WD40 repeat protein
VALSRQLAIQATRLRDSDAALAGQLAATAYRISPTPDARSALLDSSALPTATRLLGQPGATAVALSNDGRTMAVTHALDGTVQLFSIPPSGVPARLGVLTPEHPDSQLFAAAFSPDGRTLAVGGTENVVRLWDVGDPARPRPLGGPLRGFTGAVQSIAFSPSGSVLAAGGAATGVLRWDVTDPAHPGELPPLSGAAGQTQTVAFSPDGRVLAAGGTDSTVRLWTISASGAELAGELSVSPTTTLNSIAFSPDGRLMAAASKDKSIRVWDVTEGPARAQIGPVLTGFGSWVNAVAFSTDGATLAGGSSDNSIKFWAVDGWKQQAPALTSPAPVTGIKFLPGNRRLVSVGQDGAARLWPWPGPIISGASDTVFGLSYSRDGGRLAVFPNRGDDTVQIWDATDPQRAHRIGGVQIPPDQGMPAGTGALSPDGNTLVVGIPSGVLRLWNVTDAEHPLLLQPTLTGPTQLIEQVAFSPDGLLIAAGSDDGTVTIWGRDTADGSPIATLRGPETLVLGIAFSPNGRLLAAASADKRVWLWDISSPQRPVLLDKLVGFDNYAYSVAFSPDGHLLAAGSADKTVRLWDLADVAHPRALGGPLSGPGNYVFSLTFHPGGKVLTAAVTDGTLWQWDLTNPVRPRAIATLTAAKTSQVFIVTYSPDGTTLAAGDNASVHFWTADPAGVAKGICAMAGDPITPKEWAQYVPTERYRPPCP